MSEKNPAVGQDWVVLISGSSSRLVTFDRGSLIVRIENRPLVIENVPVAGDGTTLRAVDPAGGRSIVTVIETQRVLYVGSVVVDQAGWIGAINRTVPLIVAARIA